MLATGPSATSGARTSRPRSTTSRRVGDDQGSQARTPRGPTSGYRADQGAAASGISEAASLTDGGVPACGARPEQQIARPITTGERHGTEDSSRERPDRAHADEGARLRAA